ncbi:MAG: lytic murein transglycosylase [Rickettsiales bacterium]|nr:lytic murein transglycosylase [Rickettsiales bacterium]
MKKISVLIVGFLCLMSSATRAETGAFDFDRWNTMLNNIQNRAVAEKIDDGVINATIQDAAFIPKIVWRDKNQAEFKMTMDGYLARMINDKRIGDGKKMRKTYPTLLNKVYEKYGVPPNVILAFWGMESNYGKYKSHYQLSDAFLTLIYEGRRETFFTDQLLALMRIADKNNLAVDEIRGSWAGAMGHFQFIPTTLLAYGADGNGDKKIDIIHNISDAMFSAGNYLNKLGWNKNEKILRRVELPENFDTALCDGKTKMPLNDWGAMGIVGVPNADIIAGIVCDTSVIPQTSAPCHQTAYLTYPNFYRIKRWNNSNWYAVAIGVLADELK